jgi:hypothetical protein
VDFPQPGTEGCEVTTFECVNGGQELLVAKHTGATESSVGTHLDHPRHAANMVIVPVRGHDQHDDPSRVEVDAPQVVQGGRGVSASTRVHDDPGAVADV